MTRKAQAAFEYAAIFTIAFVGLVMASIFLFNYGINTLTEVKGAQLARMCNDIVYTAEQVYAEGEPAKRTLPLNMPEHMRNISILEDPTDPAKAKELRFEIMGAEMVYCVTQTNITGSFDTRSWSQGDKRVIITAHQHNVDINITP